MSAVEIEREAESRPDVDPTVAEPSAETRVPEPLPADERYHLLQCGRRRDALRYLAAHGGGPVTMRDLAEQVAAWEHDTTLQALTSKERQRVYIPLYQTHLPKLDEAGVIHYDKHRGDVERGPRAGELEPYLDLATPGVGSAEPTDGVGDGVAADDRVTAVEAATTDGTETPSATATEAVDGEAAADRWSRYYLGALGASTALLLGAALAVPPVASLPDAAVAGLIALLFSLLSLGDFVDSGRSGVSDGSE